MKGISKPIIGGPLDGGTYGIHGGEWLTQSMVGTMNNVVYRYTWNKARDAWIFDSATPVDRVRSEAK